MRLAATLVRQILFSKKEREDIDYALNILYCNQNTHGDKKSDAQSVRAYQLFKMLFTDLL